MMFVRKGIAMIPGQMIRRRLYIDMTSYQYTVHHKLTHRMRPYQAKTPVKYVGIALL